MNIVIQSEEELIRTLREALHILNNMRNVQKLWDERYGVELKNKKKTWEGKADEFLKSLDVTKTKYKTDIKLINPNTP